MARQTTPDFVCPWEDQEGGPFKQPLMTRLRLSARARMHSAPLPSILPFQDIFLLCFAVDNHVSYGNVRDTWIEEIRHHCPKTPVILVGTKVSRSLARSVP